MTTPNDDDPQKKFAGFPPKSYGWGLTINFYRVLHPFSRSS